MHIIPITNRIHHIPATYISRRRTVLPQASNSLCFFFFQAEDGIRDWRDWSSDVCSSDLAVFGEVPVVAVDHRQAGAHVAGEVEGGDAGAEREGGEGVPEIVDAADWVDPERALGGLPVAVTEVVQVEVPAAGCWEHERRVWLGPDLVECLERDLL